MNGKSMRLAAAMTVVFVFAGVIAQPAAALTGAIFTTDSKGHAVNGNIYKDKCDVYLDGGPGPNAPASSAALPEGWYYFQVTDPSGKVLLSTDSIDNRRFYVNDEGVIESAETHTISEDRDGKQYGAVVVQLCPFNDTPNSGGVYKVWVTRQVDYDGDYLSGRHGFIPAFCKTDNFKVGKKPPVQYLVVKKFQDCNANGLNDEGEAWLSGWDLHITPSDGPTFDPPEATTPLTLDAWPGTWSIEEIVKDRWLQTALIVDGVPQNPISDTATVVFGTTDQTHTVIFGNISLTSITACKFYDRNFNGLPDTGEPFIQGVKVILTGTDVCGPIEARTLYTGPSGCATFNDLLPGTYTVTEIVPTNCAWVPTGDASVEVTLGCEENAAADVGFGNVITGIADFDTKGYWHNKNGLAEITDGDIAHVNGLAPYSTASAYFGAGDEPFDGRFADGTTPVEPAYDNDKITDGISAGAGTARAEISHFLVDSNTDADLNGHKEQLAQQLLAFIFNVEHRIGGAAAINVPGAGWTTTSSLIADAIAAWQSGSAAECVAIAGLLDSLNNNSALEYVLDEPPATCIPIPEY